MAKVRVYVFRRAGSPHWQMKWRDPRTKADVRRSTGTTIRREAERQAAKIEQRFADGTYSEPQYTTWKEFRHRYEQEHLEGLADSTYKKAVGTLSLVEDLVRPKLLSEVDAGAISRFVQQLRRRVTRPGKPISESTIKSHLTHLKAALNWAKSTAELIEVVPSIPKIARAKKLSGKTPMKGRPLTEEEFDRLILAIPKVVGADRAPSWEFLLRGLWLSGLRLDESLNLYWSGDDVFRVDLSGKYPMFLVRDEGEKGHRDRILPMAPEFAEFLRQVPEKKRRGRIFSPKLARVFGDRMHLHTASKTISKIGAAAKVRVTATKPASAQDLRRSFGERWAKRVMPTILQQMMRHEQVETTLRYYVGTNAENVARTIYEAQSGNNLGNNPVVPGSSPISG